MLNKIISFALHNRLIVLISAILLTIAGIYIADTMEVDVFPDLNAPTVVVMTEAQGMAAEEVEKTVTFPIETAVNGATDVRRVRSNSTAGFSVVWVEFDWGTDIYRARQIVSEKMASISEALPSGAGSPTLGPQSSILGEVFIIGLSTATKTPGTTLEQLRTIADWNIRPQLLSLGGVAQVAVIGGDIKEYQILLDLDKMSFHGVSLDEVIAATKQMNTNSSGGVLYQYSQEYLIRATSSTASTDDIASSLVKLNSDGYPITLGDIATVCIGAKTPAMGSASIATKPGVILTITKQPNTSTNDLTEQIHAKLAELQKSLPQDIVIHDDIFRQSDFIDSSIGNIKRALFEGAIFVVIVLLLFLMNVRTTLISLVTIPLSLLITIIILKLTGLSINTMSIGGMAIAIGSLVDDAIVDVENVYKRLRENYRKGSKRPILDIIYDASREVRMPILSSTIIIVVSFVPLFFLSGIEGRMLIPLGISFIVSLFSSTLIALTLTPVLCSYLLKSSAKQAREPFITRALHGLYSKALNVALKHKALILSVAGALLIGAIFLLVNSGSSFLPPFNEGSFTINVSTLPGTSLEQSDAIGRRAEQLILSIPEIQTVARKTGRAELDEHALGVNTSEIEAPFHLEGRSKSSIINELRHKLSEIPGANIEIGQPISHRIDAMLSGTQAAIAIKLFGSELSTLYSKANEIKEAISPITNLVDINVEQQIERAELQIIPRRELLASYGITMAEFNEFVELCIAGTKVSQVYEGDKVFDLTLKADGQHRDSIEELMDACIDSPRGRIPLSQVAQIVSSAGPNSINRENAQRLIVISANCNDGNLQGAVDAIKEAIDARIDLPEGYHIIYGGQFESAQRATRSLALTSGLALIVIFLLLYAQMHNKTQAAVVLLNLPLALIGGVVAIALDDALLSIPAIIGFISLFGIATRNGMLLIDRYNALRSEGRTCVDAVMTGSLDRLNPILMTALTSTLALIPLVIGGDLPGNEIQSPMARVILGGLLSSTALNAFIIPIVYSIIERRTQKSDS